MSESLAESLGNLTLSQEDKKEQVKETKDEITTKPKTGLLYDPRMCLHEEEGHVESPKRITSIYETLVKFELDKKCKRIEARNITEEEVLMVHTKRHYDEVQSWKKCDLTELDHAMSKYNSIYINEHTTECADLSAGSVVQMTESVLKGEVENGVVLCRPPGHHAEPDYCMGFCFYNNVGIAAEVAKRKYGIKRILILDWDVHHGNATQTMFYNDPSVLFFSLHRFDNGSFYPCKDDAGPSFVGEGEGKGKNVNVAWNCSRIKDGSYLRAIDQILLPMLDEFDPELIIISAGFDSANGDPLGGLCVSPGGYSQITHKLKKYAGGKIVVALEGGYNLSSISMSMAGVVCGLIDDPLEATDNVVELKCQKDINETIKNHLPYWKNLKLVELPETPTKASPWTSPRKSPLK